MIFTTLPFEGLCGLVFIANIEPKRVTQICELPQTTMTVSNISDNGATLNTGLNGYSSYEFNHRIVGATSWIVSTSTTGSLTVNDLTTAAQYEFRVRVRCANNEWSAWSNVQNFTTTSNNACILPQVNLNVTGVTTTNASLNAGINGFNAYEFNYRAVGASVWITRARTNPVLMLSILVPSTLYEFQIRVQCANGAWSSWSGVHQFRTMPKDNCTAASINADSFSLFTAPPILFNASCNTADGYIELKLRTDRGPYLIEWFPTKGTGENPRQNLEPGFYQAIVLDSKGCLDTIRLKIDQVKNCDNEFEVSSTFTPNADGINETLIIKVRPSINCPNGRLSDCYPNHQVKIFNNKGEMIYRSKNYQSDWQAKGHPAGEYYLLLDPDVNVKSGLIKKKLTILK